MQFERLPQGSYHCTKVRNVRSLPLMRRFIHTQFLLSCYCYYTKNVTSHHVAAQSRLKVLTKIMSAGKLLLHQGKKCPQPPTDEKIHLANEYFSSLMTSRLKNVLLDIFKQSQLGTVGNSRKTSHFGQKQSRFQLFKSGFQLFNVLIYAGLELLPFLGQDPPLIPHTHTALSLPSH